MEKKQQGSIFVFILIIIFVFVLVMVPVVENIIAKLEQLRLSIAREQAFQIAEAGRNYYEWHFVKFPNDFADGTGIEATPGEVMGPFTHSYVDYETQQVIGYFDLYITVPHPGQEVRIIKSVGRTISYPNVTRTVEVKYQKDTVAQYSVFTNSPGYIFTDIKGKFYSTSGIRDIMPTASGQIISEKSNANLTYTCPIENLYPCPTIKRAMTGTCPTGQTCCDPNSSHTTTYGKCILNGGGKPCATDSDCLTGVWSDICPAGETCCNQAGQCVVDGGGARCSLDNDCPSGACRAGETCCNQAGQCVVDGGGRLCSIDSDCASATSLVDARSWWTKTSDPAVVWTNVISDSFLAQMKTLSQNGDIQGYISQTAGIVLGTTSNAGSSIVFNSDGTYSVYKVTSLVSTPRPSTYWDGTSSTATSHSEITDYSTRSQINCGGGQGCLGDNYLIPSNGVIYVDNGYSNNLWVEGTLNGRVTLVVAALPYNSSYSTSPSIYIPNHIKYDESCDGTCALGLISQNYILTSFLAPANLEIDGALITQYKSIGRLNYSNDSNKGTITTYGSFISNGKSYFGYSSPDRGYVKWNLNYDSNLLESPPPYFPAKSQKYSLIYWKSD